MKLFSEKYESFLDGGAGSCLLAKPAIAKICGALAHFQGIRYRVLAWCVMPNHVHVVFQPLGEWTLAQILHTWKSYSAHKVGGAMKKSQTFWQREYYDHWVRSDADLQRCVRYVLRNPGKAGLRHWPWVGTTFPM